MKLIENVKGRIGMKKVPRCWVGSDSISYSSLPPVVCADTSHTANKWSYVIVTFTAKKNMALLCGKVYSFSR